MSKTVWKKAKVITGRLDIVLRAIASACRDALPWDAYVRITIEVNKP